ncbi:MAG: hypothetical protein JWO97_1467 [Acidobacteria bacterium]|nr:hypothetical protein [Acidobacteriota bacterium]
MLTPHVLWALRNGEPLEPSQRRTARHLGLWATFAYVEVFAYDLVAPELVIVAAIAAIGSALYVPWRSQTSFIAMHAALIVSLSMAVWRAPDATPVIDLFLLVLLVVTRLMTRRRIVPASLLLLHALMFLADPWSLPSSTITSAHFVARVLAIVMVASMLFIRRPAPRVVETFTPPPSHVRPLSASEWDRATR